MLPQIVAFAVTSTLAKKAWDRYQSGKRRLPEDITHLVGRPEAVQPPASPQRARPAPRARKEGPSS